MGEGISGEEGSEETKKNVEFNKNNFFQLCKENYISKSQGQPLNENNRGAEGHTFVANNPFPNSRAAIRAYSMMQKSRKGHVECDQCWPQ